jgi:hypothetical protein
MVRTEPKYRRPLNTSQLNVLKLLYKFRFADTELIARYDNVSHRRVVFSRINILYQQGYIGRHYDNTYRIDRKKAVYFLLAKGMKALKELPDFNTAIINSIYKDKIASEQFRERNLNIFAICCSLKTLYTDKIKFFTKSDLVVFGYFPQPLPDAYIKLELTDGDIKHFFLDYYDLARPFFIHRRKIDTYIKYDEEGDWDVTKTKLPLFFSVCENTSLLKRTAKRMAQAVDDSYYSKIKFYGADLKTIAKMKTSSDKVWKLAVETKLISTEEIIEKAV